MEEELWAVRVGAKGEKEAANHIDFDWKGGENRFVIHDLRLEHDGRVAQIDQMILHRTLHFHVMESKAFGREVRISDSGEWDTRTKFGWRGIPSPVEQNRRHIEVFKSFIDAHGLALKRLGTSAPAGTVACMVMTCHHEVGTQLYLAEASITRRHGTGWRRWRHPRSLRRDSRMVPLIRRVLVTLLDFQRRRPALEKQAGAERVAELAQRLEQDIEELWTLMAGLQALGKPHAAADARHPGYVEMRVSDSPVESVYVPFHLVPATPDLPVLAEVLSLAAHVRVGEVDGRPAMICLSGSTVILRDVMRVGDIDFCEYVPAEVAPAALAEAFTRQVRASDARYCTISLRLKALSGGADESELIDVRQRSAMTAEQLHSLSRFVAMAGNGKTAHVMDTLFAGVTEVTNWLIIFQPPLENDRGSKLSFAHQEAPLSTFAHRALHTLEALAAYLNFLRIEMETHATAKPVKAVKRAIPWLRLFRADELLSELVEKARRSGALQCAAVLSKIELLRKYDGVSDLKPDLQALLASLHSEIDSEANRLFGDVGDLETALGAVVDAFGQDLVAPAKPAAGRLPLLSRALLLAETEPQG